MRKNHLAVFLSVAIMVGAAGPLDAAVLSFNGTATARPNSFADPSCAPLPFRGVISPTPSGVSNLGGFSYSHDSCTQGATGPAVVGSSFTIDFGESSFSGLFNGTTTPRAGTPGLFDQIFTYTITDGTGQFAGATGSFTNIGTADSRGGPPPLLTFSFAGTIDAPAAVPEPASWALMIGGFGLVGGALRRRTVARRFA